MKKFVISVFGFIYLNALSCSSVNDVKKYGGHYYTITAKKMTFLNAKTFAEANDGYLAIPNSSGENNFLKSLIPTPKYAWIGVYDPDYMTNYCYGEDSCSYDDSRFVDIKGNGLSYTNWAEYQPDNLVKIYDITDDGRKMVSPLGEHWVAISSIDGKWADFGNHADEYNNPIKYYALIEFDKMPDCYTPPSDVTDTYSGAKCNTQIWDKKTGTLQKGKTYTCLEDKKGQSYCPVALAECGQEWDYKDGYAVEHTGIVRDYTNRIKHTSYLYFDCKPTIIEFSGSYGHLPAKLQYGKNGDIATAWGRCHCWDNRNIYGRFKCENGSWKYLDGGSSKYYAPIPSAYSSSAATVRTSKYYSGKNDGRCWKNWEGWFVVLSGGYNVPSVSGKTYICPSGYTMSGNRCIRDISYSYYEYKCGSDRNYYENDYVPTNSGLSNCGKSDPDTSRINSSTLDDSCNSSRPPHNNCKRKKFVCQPAPDRKCALVDNKWQCSPFPCFGEGAGDYDVTNADTPVGINDKKNDGWNNDGSCSGSIYIFNGKDKRCRSSDTFFGFTGGGCCDKDKVFMGVVQCKEDEKNLAKKRDKKQCHYIGEYCSKELNLLFTKVCIQHKKTYCCFNSKLARIINEQGRPQIGKSWGSAKSPNCSGFKPEEFQKLDFSKLDLSEFYDQITQNVTQSFTKNMNTYIQNSVTNQLKDMTSQ